MVKFPFYWNHGRWKSRNQKISCKSSLENRQLLTGAEWLTGQVSNLTSEIVWIALPAIVYNSIIDCEEFFFKKGGKNGIFFIFGFSGWKASNLLKIELLFLKSCVIILMCMKRFLLNGWKCDHRLGLEVDSTHTYTHTIKNQHRFIQLELSTWRNYMRYCHLTVKTHSHTDMVCSPAGSLPPPAVTFTPQKAEYTEAYC